MERMNSSAPGFTSRKPVMALTSIGKKESSAATTILGVVPKPNTITSTGAMATIGVTLITIASGNSARSASRECAITTARAIANGGAQQQAQRRLVQRPAALPPEELRVVEEALDDGRRRRHDDDRDVAPLRRTNSQKAKAAMRASGGRQDVARLRSARVWLMPGPPSAGCAAGRRSPGTARCAPSPACAAAAARCRWSARTLPGRGDSTMTRSDRAIASEMEWVTNSTVLRPERPRSARCAAARSAWTARRDLVQGAERLVHQQQRGVEGQRAGDGDALLHAAGELVRVVVAEVREARQLQQLLRRGRGPVAGGAVDLEREADVAEDGAPGQEGRVLEHEADVAAALRRGGRGAVDPAPRRWWAAAGRRRCAGAWTCRSRWGR